MQYQPTTSRRTFIAGAAMASAIAGAKTFAQPTPEKTPKIDPTGYVDAHVHVWTPDTSRYPLAAGFKQENMKPPSFTPEQLFEHCRPSGVERIVLIQMSFYRFDNSYMLDTLERFPSTFSAVGIVDEHAAGVGQRMKELAKRGVRGFRVHPGKGSPEAWLGSSGMAEMWSTAADANLAICPLVNPNCLPALDRMCERYPRTKVVIDHFARIGIASPTHGEDLDRLCKIARFPKVHVKTSAFYALGEKKAPYLDLGPMIRRLRDTFGAERLMWASDSPFQVQNGHTYAASISLIRDRLDFLTDADRAWLLKKTAEQVFFAS
jgi:predicted TIM-barrel fold metal-dependent hydrolase